MIFFNKQSGQINEWILIELQGSIEFRNTDSFNSLQLGSISFVDQNNATLIIGNHQLEGKIQHLKHPIAILNQKNSYENQNVEDKKIEIVAICSKKCTFKTRPKPIRLLDDLVIATESNNSPSKFK
eukprot:TRINITY_DN7676_c0_g1_i1.p1 TRINITY_DN7676_c0_g1~~TRINITY_DN7676_c0_g1_i1.p1  ORF type:complete len:126 (-),score=57.62 TRINITY_DN7676_c0_g1_i1:71-448(-)